MLILYLFILAITILACFYILKFSSTSNSDTDKEENVKTSAKSNTISRKNMTFDNADVMTCNGPGNICVAIFKNPLDRKTHFYRTRLRGMYLCTLRN